MGLDDTIILEIPNHVHCSGEDVDEIYIICTYYWESKLTGFTMYPHCSNRTRARVPINTIVTQTIVLAWVAGTFVYIWKYKNNKWFIVQSNRNNLLVSQCSNRTSARVPINIIITQTIILTWIYWNIHSYLKTIYF
jgi:hypothetical protein